MSGLGKIQYRDSNLTVRALGRSTEDVILLRLRDDEGQTVAHAFMPGILWSYLHDHGIVVLPQPETP